ncbi:MAG: DUF4954 family protein [Paludibacteraceae bacterium]|nr:DUF4954 family protein [Paludibacteraceae bacterium]
MRTLSASEINVLQQQGCLADDWSAVTVADAFNPQYIRNVRFFGPVELGCFERSFVAADGFPRHSGIYNAALHNCKVGDDCYIGNVRDHIANYNIGNNTFINNVDLLACSGICSFGNGVQVAALNEGGGREITICDLFSSHLGYFMAMFRNRVEAVAHLESLVSAYTEGVKSEMGTIGAGAVVVNCGTITGVNIGEAARLDGCSLLQNGTVLSSTDAPSVVGADVIAHDFIFCKAVKVTAGAQILRCYVGEGSQVGEQFAATDCFISCNCQFFHGEAASMFAGPYTVSHHKATLLIAISMSFFNAGSGSNQSNHAYKLGPNHQGVLDRGSKLASSSYLLWPAHLGAFTTVLGSHKEHPDTTSLPFSYLIDNHGVPYVSPGANLKSVGTMRDADKFPKRDGRSKGCADRVSFNMLNPLTVAQILKGVAVLEGLLADVADEYVYGGLRIKAKSAKHGLELYRMALNKYKGDLLLKWEADGQPALMTAKSDAWVDLGGLIVPADVLDQVGAVKDLAAANDLFATLEGQLSAYECGWAAKQFPGLFEAKQKMAVLDDWHEACVCLIDSALCDAKKEFAPAAMLGYGLDPVGDCKDEDFKALRGEYGENNFVKSLQSQLDEVHVRYSEAVSVL